MTRPQARPLGAWHMQDADLAIADRLGVQIEGRDAWLTRALLAAGEGWAIVDEAGRLDDVAGPFLDLLGASGLPRHDGAGLGAALRGLQGDGAPAWPPAAEGAWHWTGSRQDGRALEVQAWAIAEARWAVRVRPVLAAPAPVAPAGAPGLYHPATRMPLKPLLMDRLQLAIDRSCRTVTQRFALVLIGLNANRDFPDGRAGADATHAAHGREHLRAVVRQLESAVRPADTIAHLDDSLLAVIIEPIRGDDSMVRSAVSAFVDGMRRALNDVPSSIPVGTRAVFAVALGDGSSHPADLLTKAKQRLSGRGGEPAMAPQRGPARTGVAPARPAIKLDIEFQLAGRVPQAVAAICDDCPEGSALLSALLAGCDSVAWPDDLKPDLVVASRTLPSVEAVQALQRAQGLWRSDARLVLEPDEAALARDPEAAIFLGEAVARRGVRLSVGRFGLGHCTDALLGRLPLSRVALDPGLVADGARASESRVKLAATIASARERGLQTIAAGITDPTLVEFLCGLGCDSARGPALRAGAR